MKRHLSFLTTTALLAAAPVALEAQERRDSSPAPSAPVRDVGAVIDEGPSSGLVGADAALLERLAALQAEVRLVRRQYDARLDELETELASLLGALANAAPSSEHTAPEPESAAPHLAPAAPGLEAATPPLAPTAPEPAVPDFGLSTPDDASGETIVDEAEASDSAVAQSTDRARNLNQLNPEISVTGDMFGTVSDISGSEEANQFRIASFEMTLQSDLDPYSQAKAFVVFEDGAFDLEEMYIDWNTLPAGLGLKVGAFRNDFGKVNRWHQHALAQADRPLAHRAFFGEEGLRGLGASLSWLMPASLGDYGELWVQVTNDDNDVAFSGKGFDDPLFLVHQTNYWDLSAASYFELGFSGTTGTNDELGDQRTWVWGTDFNFAWQPPERALYTGFEMRGELLYQTRDTELGTDSSWGGYTYGTARLNRQWLAGVRADWSEIPLEPGESAWGLSPYIEWWQSEWTRLRFQFTHSSRQVEVDEPENRFFFQITWALGPHKHEKY